MFDNLDQKQKKIASQKLVGNAVVRKKAGRPKKPFSMKKHVKIPVLLIKEINTACEHHGMGFSAFLCMAAREKLAAMKNEFNINLNTHKI